MNSTMVVVTWLRSLGLPNVGPLLFSNYKRWAAEGFVQPTIIGGGADVQPNLRKVAMQVDCWAVGLDTDGVARPDWGKANDLAETVFTAAQRSHPQVLDIMDKGVLVGRVGIEVYPDTEPRPAYNDPNGFARYTLDVLLNYATIEELV